MEYFGQNIKVASINFMAISQNMGQNMTDGRGGGLQKLLLLLEF